MNLVYFDSHGKNAPVVYDGDISDGLTHTIRLADGSKIAVNNSNLQLIDQPDFSKIPKTPLDYRNEVGTRLTLKEAQNLSLPRSISPLHKELMSWNHRSYNIP